MIHILIKTLFIAFISTVIVGCEKENLSNPDIQVQEVLTQVNKKNKSIGISLADLYNAKNPFDNYGVQQESLFDELEVLLSDANLTLTEFESNYSVIISSNTNLYPTIPTLGYEIAEASLFAAYLDGINIDNILTKSVDFEDNVVNNINLSTIQKNRLLSLVSQHKYYFYITANLMHHQHNLLSYHPRLALLP